jgi:hypothetical protein
MLNSQAKIAQTLLVQLKVTSWEKFVAWKETERVRMAQSTQQKAQGHLPSAHFFSAFQNGRNQRFPCRHEGRAFF